MTHTLPCLPPSPQPMRMSGLDATSHAPKTWHWCAAQTAVTTCCCMRAAFEAVTQWLTQTNLAQGDEVADFAAFTANEHFGAILNLVGVGNPAQASAIGASIIDVTLKYDEFTLGYVSQHPTCRYIFLSSGAAYGSSFETPADANTKAVIDINHLKPQDWYGVAKLHAECRHRSLVHLPIVDIRVFNYFSHAQDIEARFLITDILRAIRDKTVLKTSSDYIVRDYLHPSDFYQLVCALLSAPAANATVDCYSRAPIDKPNLLIAMQEHFGLQYDVTQANVSFNATGIKPHYYSQNARASDFGYQPALTSLDGIVKEIQVIFQDTVIGSDKE